MILEWQRCTADYEIFLVRVSDEYFAYAPLKHTSLRITAEGFARCVSGDETALSVVRDRFKSKPTISLKEYRPTAKFEPSRGDLALTTRCNLNCIYCHANSNYRPRDLDEKIGRVAIDFILRNAKVQGVPYAQIGFNGGGEPTVAFNLMRNLISYAQQRAGELGVRVAFGMVTNGFFSERICNFIAEHFSHVSISIDGPAIHQNRHRPTLSGFDSFERVFRNAKRLHDSRVPSLNLRATVSERSVDYLEDILRFFMAEFPRAGYAFMPINRLGRGEACPIRPPDPVRYIDNFEDILLRQQLCSLEKVYFMCGTLSTVRSTFCDAFSGPGFNLTVDGVLASCQRDNLPTDFSFGRITRQGGIIVDYDRLNHDKRPRIFTDPLCVECFAKYHCGGECMDLVVHRQSRCDAMQRWNAYELKYLHNKTTVARGD